MRADPVPAGFSLQGFSLESSIDHTLLYYPHGRIEQASTNQQQLSRKGGGRLVLIEIHLPWASACLQQALLRFGEGCRKAASEPRAEVRPTQTLPRLIGPAVLEPEGSCLLSLSSLRSKPCYRLCLRAALALTNISECLVRRSAQEAA